MRKPGALACKYSPHRYEGVLVHTNSEKRSDQQQHLGWVLLLTGAFMVLEVVVGLYTGSLALLANASHMLSDVGELSLSIFSIWVAGKPSTPEKAYSDHRAEILGAVLTAVVLLGLVVWILYEAYDRFWQPPQVHGVPLVLVGLMGLAVDLTSIRLLGDYEKESLTLHSAYMEVLSDTITSIGVILCGAIIWTTRWTVIDPLLGMGICLFIVWRTWTLLSQAINVLMEAVPTRVNAAEVGRAMASVPGVQGVHDLHIWTITSGLDALSSHVVVPIGENRDGVLQRLQVLLRDRFAIEHVTLQIVEEDPRRIDIGPTPPRNICP
jgi:cobalt-zinc-cadmium efflux system protein